MTNYRREHQNEWKIQSKQWRMQNPLYSIEKSKEYYKNNREHCLNLTNNWQNANKERTLNNAKNYRENNRELIRNNSKNKYSLNPELYREKARINYQQNPEKCITSVKKWLQTDKGKLWKKLNNIERVHKLHNIKHNFTLQEWDNKKQLTKDAVLCV